MTKPKPFKVASPVLKPLKKVGQRKEVQFPVSYEYNGGTIIDGELYSGYEVGEVIVPEGHRLLPLYCGLQLNARPPSKVNILVRDS